MCFRCESNYSKKVCIEIDISNKSIIIIVINV